MATDPPAPVIYLYSPPGPGRLVPRSPYLSQDWTQLSLSSLLHHAAVSHVGFLPHVLLIPLLSRTPWNSMPQVIIWFWWEGSSVAIIPGRNTLMYWKFQTINNLKVWLVSLDNLDIPILHTIRLMTLYAHDSWWHLWPMMMIFKWPCLWRGCRYFIVRCPVKTWHDFSVMITRSSQSANIIKLPDKQHSPIPLHCHAHARPGAVLSIPGVYLGASRPSPPHSRPELGTMGPMK